jgi:hypothetical protein
MTRFAMDFDMDPREFLTLAIVLARFVVAGMVLYRVGRKRRKD